MAQESISISKVAIIGAGPSGCMCAYFLQNDFDVTLFDFASPLRTLLPTGGGRCNLAHAEYDFRDLAKNYPRGEKFLYSIFSKFSTLDTVEFFENIGVKTYVQDDMRIFPMSNSAKDVREKILKSLKKVRFAKEMVSKLDFEKYDYIGVAIGGHASYSLLKGHTIIQPRPALVGLKTVEKFPQGVSVKQVSVSGIVDDILFTHEGVSGPLIYKISSLNARKDFPYKLCFDFCGSINLQDLLDKNPHKSIRNLISELVPKAFACHILHKLEINEDEKCYNINGKLRDKILDCLNNYEIEILGTSKNGEVVTCGGVSLNEVDSRTMQSKIIPNLYFCGEVLDIDGFCGGFNLQNCWSTAYVAAQSILSR
ncbi:aminoacetone oxidase family FAD-binding enzyme [bacterium]|nr:aminoacetone oxidase family FAD-binding enzyme [bacterium]